MSEQIDFQMVMSWVYYFEDNRGKGVVTYLDSRNKMCCNLTNADLSRIANKLLNDGVTLK